MQSEFMNAYTNGWRDYAKTIKEESNSKKGRFIY